MANVMVVIVIVEFYNFISGLPQVTSDNLVSGSHLRSIAELKNKSEFTQDVADH